MRNKLLWKLLAVNLPIVAIVITLIWLSVDYLAANYFMVLMDEYHISPTESHEMFLSAVHRYMIKASILAVIIAVVAGYLLTRKVLSPLSQMIKITEKISSGDYGARVDVKTTDEIGQLAQAFNRMADALKKMETLRKNMVTDVAHELRTPLTNVRGYLEAMHDGVIVPEQRTFEMLNTEVMRLTDLVENLNQLTKAEAAEININKEQLKVDEILDNLVTFYKPVLKDKNIKITVNISGKNIKVNADQNKLSQILHNLMQNACRYTPDNGNLEISVKSVDNNLQITVSNSGNPLPEDSLPFIFERFYRVDKSRSRDSGGAGIGLAIVKTLVEAHGGRVGAETDKDTNHIWFSLPK